jgi:hypothetical protein
MNSTSSAIDIDGKFPKVMHVPTRLTSPHHATVYGLMVSRCAKSFVFNKDDDVTYVASQWTRNDNHYI